MTAPYTHVVATATLTQPGGFGVSFGDAFGGPSAPGDAVLADRTGNATLPGHSGFGEAFGEAFGAAFSGVATTAEATLTPTHVAVATLISPSGFGDSFGGALGGIPGTGGSVLATSGIGTAVLTEVPALAELQLV